MMNTRRLLTMGFLVFSLWAGVGAAEWAEATSCPQHEAVKDQAADVANQPQQLAVPPVTEQPRQIKSPAPSWRKELAVAMILLAVLAGSAVVRFRTSSSQQACETQLALPFSDSNPLLVAPAA